VCLLHYWCTWEDSDSICVVEIWEDNKVFDIFLSLMKIFPYCTSIGILYKSFPKKMVIFILVKLNLACSLSISRSIFFPLNSPKISVHLSCCLNFRFHFCCKNLRRQHFYVFLCVLKIFPYCTPKDILENYFPKKWSFSFW